MDLCRPLESIRPGNIDALHEWDANISITYSLLTQRPQMTLEVDGVITEMSARYCGVTFRRCRRDVVLESPNDKCSRNVACSRLARGYYVFFSSMIPDKEMSEIFQ